MSSETAIESRGLGKAYRLYARKRDRLLQVLSRDPSKLYREHWALHPIDLAVERGEAVAIVGRNGERASMIPFELALRGADYGEESFHFELVRNTRLAPLLAGTAAANALSSNSGYNDKATMLAHGRIEIRDLPTLTFELALAGESAGAHTLAIAGYLARVISGLWNNPFAPVEIERTVMPAGLVADFEHRIQRNFDDHPDTEKDCRNRGSEWPPVDEGPQAHRDGEPTWDLHQQIACEDRSRGLRIQHHGHRT